MQHISTLGDGVKILIIHAPDPLSTIDSSTGKEERIKNATYDIIRLAISLEQHGFSVLTGLDANPDNKLEWYNTNIQKSHFALLVYSPALDYIFSANFVQSSDLQVNLIHNAYITTCSILSQQPNTEKFIPVVIDPAYRSECSFFFTRRVYYAVREVEVFDVNRCIQNGYVYESLVCRMAGIDIATIVKSECKRMSAAGDGARSSPEVTPNADPGADGLSGMEATAGLHNKVGQGPGAFMYRSPCTHTHMESTTRLSGTESNSLSATEGLLSIEVASQAAGPTSGTAVTSQTSPLDMKLSPDTGLEPAISHQQRVQASRTSLLDRKVDQTVLPWLSEQIREWRLFARYLKCIRTEDIKKCACSELPNQQCFEMLKTWHAINPLATYKQLCDALEMSILNRELVEDFLNKIQEIG